MPRAPLKEVFLNGAFLAAGAAQVSVFDRGFLFGDGVYEVIPVYGGHLFHADKHLERLASSLEGIELEVPWDMQWFRHTMDELVQRNGGGDQSLYLQVTRGTEHGRDHRFPPSGTRPTVFMFTTATPPRDMAVDRDGIKAVIAEDFRWQRCHLKVTSLLANVLLKNVATSAGADEVILHREGRLTEASVSNVCIVRDGKVLTPSLSHEILPGVTRLIIIALCREAGIPLTETDLTTSDLERADEIWVSSSTRELAPVTLLDGRLIGGGKPGTLYPRVRAAFDAHIDDCRHNRL